MTSRLKIKSDQNGFIISWWRITFIDFILLLLWLGTLVSLFGNLANKTELFGLKVLPPHIVKTPLFYSIITILTLHFIFNLVSTFTIKNGQVRYNKRRIGIIMSRHKASDIRNVESKVRIGSSSDDGGMNDPDYKVYILLKGNKKYRLGDFKYDDAKKIKSAILKNIN